MTIALIALSVVLLLRDVVHRRRIESLKGVVTEYREALHACAVLDDQPRAGASS